MGTVDMRRRAARCRLFAIRDANTAKSSDNWMALAEQWDRLAEAYEAEKAIKERFVQITRQSRTAHSTNRRRTRKAARTASREPLSKRTKEKNKRRG